MKKKLPLWGLLAVLLTSCFKEVGVPVTIDFVYTLADSSFTVPADVNFINRCTGATNYRWTFDGGDPAFSDYENPGTIVYKQAGAYKVKLEAWNEDVHEVKEITFSLDSAVQVAFDADIAVNNFSPVTVALTNHTIGASTYAWTFEGGEPAISNVASPGPVTFTTAGNHLITLKVSNGSKQFSASKLITVKPPLQADMLLTPSFFDDDLEAPLTATLQNKSSSYLTQRWLGGGGEVANDALSNTTVYFKDPGSYTVSLEVGNGKETKTISKQITVKPNTHLRTLRDVKIGISTAHAGIGCFYSTRLRRIYKQGDDITTEGKEIDIAFFGLNQGFSYNKFISPDNVTDYTLPAIPGATGTIFINSAENCGCSILTAQQFDAMTDDALLKSLTIQASTAADRQFDNTLIPRIILFKTQDGRKGAIKLKQFVQDGKLSYILADIKIQKYE